MKIANHNSWYDKMIIKWTSIKFAQIMLLGPKMGLPQGHTFYIDLNSVSMKLLSEASRPGDFNSNFAGAKVTCPVGGRYSHFFFIRKLGTSIYHSSQK